MTIVYIKYKDGHAEIVPTSCGHTDIGDVSIRKYMICIRTSISCIALHKWSDDFWWRAWNPIERAEDVFGHKEINIEEYAKHVISNLNSHNGEYNSVSDPYYKWHT